MIRYLANQLNAADGKDLQISTNLRAGTVSPACKHAPSDKVVDATSSTSRSDPVMVRLAQSPEFLGLIKC